MFHEVWSAVLREPEAAIDAVHGDPANGAVVDGEENERAGPVAIELDDFASDVIDAVVVKAVRGAVVHLLAIGVDVRSARKGSAGETKPTASSGRDIPVGANVPGGGDTNINWVASR